MKLYVRDERPSVLPAVCAPWSGLPVLLIDDATAHVDHVGRSAVLSDTGDQSAQLQMRGRKVQVLRTSGFVVTAAKENRTAPKPIGGARGVPPRGRPV